MFHVKPKQFYGPVNYLHFRELNEPLAITSPTQYAQCTGFLTSHKIVMWASGVKQGLRFIVFNRDD